MSWRKVSFWRPRDCVLVARCFDSALPLWVRAAVVAIRGAWLCPAEPVVSVSFTRPFPRPVAIVVGVLFFALCSVSPALMFVRFGWWACTAVIVVLAVLSVRYSMAVVGSFQGYPATALVLHDFVAATRGTARPEGHLRELLARFDEPIKLRVDAQAEGLVAMYTRLGFIRSLEIGTSEHVSMIRPA